MANNDLRIKIKVDSNTGELVVANKEFGKLSKSIGTASKSVTNFHQRITQMAHLGAIIYAVKQGFDVLYGVASKFINTAAEFEQFGNTLQTIEGNSQKAAQSMQWIEQFTSKTPYELANVTSSFVKLKSYGIEPTDGTLRTLGDTASAMGKPIIQAVEAMADAVVGENERLKEFGIRANVMGDQIKYSWTNASGQARQTIVNNNAQIIQSTLSSIFNSKYAGAMKAQSETLKGMLSNISDSYTIFQKNIMDGGLFEYIKAITSVVGDGLRNGFLSAAEGATAFAEHAINVIKSTITGFGFYYDALETIADFFKVLWYSGETAFYGIQVVTSTAALAIYEGWETMANGVIGLFEGIANGVQDMFEGTVNFAIDSINQVVRMLNNLPFVNIPLVGNVSFSKIDFERVDLSSDIENLLKQRVIPSREGFDKASSNLSASLNDLFDTGRGSEYVKGLIAAIDSEYAKIKNSVKETDTKTDFGDTIANAEEILNSVTPVINTANETVDNLNTSFENLDNTFNDDTYGVIATIDTTNDSFDNLNNTSNDFNSTLSDIENTMDDATQAVESFVFRWQDTFMNSITSNAQTLYNIGSQSVGFTDIEYDDALFLANQARLNLANNPFDIEIGKDYETAFNQLIDSANTYLDASNFASSQEFAFAQASIGSEVESFQQSALQGYDVLTSMNDLLSSINQAFEDGILSDAERADITSVADNVNANNNILLNDVSTDSGILTSLNGQTYYDNTGLATDTALTGANNSVSSFIQALMGSEGNVSLATVAEAAQSAVDVTGLDPSDISNIDESTFATITAIDNLGTQISSLPTPEVNVTVSGQTSSSSSSSNTVPIGTTTTRQEPIYNVRRVYTGTWLGVPQYESQTDYDDITGYRDVTYSWNGSDWQRLARGGYTGQGSNYIDETGHKVAGIVHDNEWVAPKWMLSQNPETFDYLEAVRQKGTFAKGGFTSSNIALNKNDNKELISEIKALKKELEAIKNNTKESRFI